MFKVSSNFSYSSNSSSETEESSSESSSSLFSSSLSSSSFETLVFITRVFSPSSFSSSKFSSSESRSGNANASSPSFFEEEEDKEDTKNGAFFSKLKTLNRDPTKRSVLRRRELSLFVFKRPLYFIPIFIRTTALLLLSGIKTIERRREYISSSQKRAAF